MCIHCAGQNDAMAAAYETGSDDVDHADGADGTEVTEADADD